MGIHSHILEHPSEWECSPIFVITMVIELKTVIVIEMMMIMMIDTLVKVVRASCTVWLVPVHGFALAPPSTSAHHVHRNCAANISTIQYNEFQQSKMPCVR